MLLSLIMSFPGPTEVNVFMSAAGHDVEEGKKLGKGSEPAKGAPDHKDWTGQGSRRLGKNRKESVEVDHRMASMGRGYEVQHRQELGLASMEQVRGWTGQG